MKIFQFSFLLTLCFFVFELKGKQPVKIIFDTDMGPDYDDVGAIAVLHALAAQGECDILACCASDGYPTIAPTIDVFNQYFKRADIPVGAAGKDAPDFSAGNHWNDSIVTKYFNQNKTNADYPSAVEVYRKTLARQKNNSVTIVTVGFVSNLADLLQSGPDEFSPLSGLELVKKKVKNWVAMAGRFPEGGEFNVNRHPEASFEVFQHWPTPILFSGWEIGSSIFTGRRLADEGSVNNPLAWAYRYNLDTYEGKKADKRQSWDQTAVLCAVRNPEDYFYVAGPGKFVIFENGHNTWDPDTDASHYFLVHKYPYHKIADVIDELMLYERQP
ncbi:nucleoside hydrolase [Sunxiuqinia dokdonensis]|uniref:Inosine/uridine-preferring nucleoside hydrolase n=1 Tax=Sunxiuqinia dokdonensis TaxID=1409788 RepID=A0A0L8V6Z3_9BACT|nr:nucleoside hydrolase [Sunxiuqinia dokdonensis]KOH44201.1 inosine/uridine-preferring nucleoside hydrolase [Sunxiuqinia dokdonensis]